MSTLMYLCFMNEMDIRNNVLMFRFFELHKNIANKINKHFNKDGFDLQVEQFPVLMIPFFRGTISQQEIADMCGRDKSSVLRSIVSLAAKNFLMTAQDPFDKRKKMVQLTKEGKVLAQTIAHEIIKLDGMVFSCLSDIERTTFESLLKKCENHVAEL
jgi:DNA-binding MarR family transcriptional regulator